MSDNSYVFGISMTIGMSINGCFELDEQKMELLDLLEKGVASNKIQGIIHLIDSIQDWVCRQAAFTEEIVFPTMTECNKIQETPLKDLPLLINEIKTKHGKAELKRRLTEGK